MKNNSTNNKIFVQKVWLSAPTTKPKLEVKLTLKLFLI